MRLSKFSRTMVFLSTDESPFALMSFHRDGSSSSWPGAKPHNTMRRLNGTSLYPMNGSVVVSVGVGVGAAVGVGAPDRAALMRRRISSGPQTIVGVGVVGAVAGVDAVVGVGVEAMDLYTC